MLASGLRGDPCAGVKGGRTLFENKGEGKVLYEDSVDDDGASTCAPSLAASSMDSLGGRSSFSSPEVRPLDSPFLDAAALLALLPNNKDAQVCLVHHDEMQLHDPPCTRQIYELPRRVIAIENSLKGLETSRGFPKMRNDVPMSFLRSKDGKKRSLVTAYGSPACKKRRSYSGIASSGSVWEACHIVEAPVIKDSDLRLVHSLKHIRKVTQLCTMAKEKDSAFFPLYRSVARAPKAPEGLLNDDVYYSPDSLAAMKRAVGGAVEAVRQLFTIDSASGLATERSRIESSFAIVRPPGHHCCSDTNGFCFFNNTAIAARHARSVLGLARVAIVDWDFHHGDGQQTIFYKDPTVLTISIHVAMQRNSKGQDDIAFPCKKSMDFAYNGSGKGLGYNINIPWPHDQVGDGEYQEALRSIVLPALRGFNPDLILVASGFDAVEGDTLAGTLLPPRSYFEMTRQLLSLRKPVAVVLEGGYSPKLLAQASLNVVHALLGRRPPRDRDHESSTSESDSEVSRDPESEGVLDGIRRRLNTMPPWSTMRRPGSDSSPYFHEESSPVDAASREAARKLSKLIRKKAFS